MNDKKKNKQKLPEQDRHLQSPGEANRDKHINFRAIEAGDPDPSMEDNSRLRHHEETKRETKEDKQRDKTRRQAEDSTIRGSEDDLYNVKSGRNKQYDADGDIRDLE